MKKLLFLLFIPILGCSSDTENIPNRDVIVLNTNTFVSTEFEVDKEDVMGVPINGTETRVNVIKFKTGGAITYFQADEYDYIKAGTTSNTGRYSLSYPNITNIVAVHIFEETTITIKKDGQGLMYFNAGGLVYKAKLINFKN